jgi:TonB family protein
MIAAILLRTSAVFVAGLALRAALRGRSSALRHLVVAMTLLGAALVVPASYLLPSWTFVVPAFAPPPRVNVIAARPANVTLQVAAPVPGRIPPAPRPPLAPAAVWMAGFLAGVGTLVAGILRLRHIAARGTRVDTPRWTDALRTVAASYGLRRDVVLIEGTSSFVVATWGLREPRLLLPPGAAASWSDERMQAVLCHELAHIARADWAVQIVSQLVLAVLWFHPLAWIACRQLRRDSEQACDDAVLRHGIAATEYARHLVALARACRRPSWSAWMPALPMARPSAFERRIAAMLNPGLNRRPLSLGAGTAFAVMLVSLTCAVAAARPGQAPGSLSGTVYDPSGGVIPGVTLMLSSGGQRTVSTAGGALTVGGPEQPAVQATTDSAGHFSFAGIAPGRYVLSAALPGFRRLHEEFDLKAAPDWDRVVTLQVGMLQETISVSATRTSAAPASAGPTPIRVGGNIRVPVKLQDVKPIYPESMRADGREAEVQLEATIDREGAVSSVHVLNSQIHPDFAVAATDAVRQWRFRPTLLNGKPIDVVMTVTVRFSLSD